MHSTRGGDGWAMLGWWGWRNVSLLGSKQDGEELRKTMGGEHPTTGKAKGQLSPSVTLCFTVPMVVSKAERDGQPWGQHGVRGPCLHKSPPPRPPQQPGPVPEPGQTCTPRTTVSFQLFAILCSPRRAMHPLPHRWWGAPVPAGCPRVRGWKWGASGYIWLL